jgi:transposase
MTRRASQKASRTTEWGAKLYANIRSVIETARRRAIGALEAIRLTLAGMPLPNLA